MAVTPDISKAIDMVSRIKAEPWRADPVSFAVHLSKLREDKTKHFLRRPHLTMIGDRLARAFLGHGPNRVGLFTPPRHGKSESASKWFPLWGLDNDANKRFIITSYGADFAAGWGGAVRDLADEFKEHLSFKRPSGGSADAWSTGTERGGVRTTGVGGSVTGRGGDVIIIDDPVKNAEEAYSETYRKKTWEWYRSTIYTRLEPGSCLILIMTRWHDDDLAGRIKEDLAKIAKEDEANDPHSTHFDMNVDKEGPADDDMDQNLADNIDPEEDWMHEDFAPDAADANTPPPPDEEWSFVDMGALAKEDDALGRRPGQALWPARYPRKRLKQIEKAVGPWVWNSLYQQNPIVDGGDIIQRQWFSYWEYADHKRTTYKISSKDENGLDRIALYPRGECTRFQTIDLAISEKEKADYFVITTFALTPDSDLLVLHCYRDKVRGPQQRHVVREQHKLHKAHVIGIESTSYQMTLVQELQDDGLPVVELKADKAKEIRAMVAGARYFARKIFHPAGNPAWLEPFEDELVAFPNGKHDDMVDTVSYAAYGVATGMFKKKTRKKHQIPDGLTKSSRWAGL